MTIYLDVVFIENMFMNYIILFATAIINKANIKLIKIAISSVLGSLYAVFAQLAILENFVGLILKVMLSVAMVYTAFSPENFKKCLKQLLIFYLTSFTFGGVAFALLYFVKPGELLMKNGVFVGTYPIKIAALGGTVGFVIITIAFNIIKGKVNKRGIFCEIEIDIKQRKENLIAMLDTGNLLKEPITGAPVAIIEKNKLENLLPISILNNIDNIIIGNMEQIEHINEYINRFRIIPFTSLGKQNGMLLGIKADFVTVKYDEQVIRLNDVILGIYEQNLSKNNSYHALIGLDMIEEREGQNEYFRNVKV